MSSPCIKVCRLDLDNVCTGCYRTLDEITRWPYLNENVKQQILQKAKKRRDDNLGDICK